MKKLSFLLFTFLFILGLASCDTTVTNPTVNQEAIDNVIELITELPNVTEISLEDEDAVINARSEYEKLQTAEKELVKNIRTLERLEEKIKTLREKQNKENADKLIELIADLPNVNDVTLDDGKAILEIRELYDSLSEDAKKLVTNYFRFELIETHYNDLAEQDKNLKDAQVVINSIDLLPSQNLVNLSDKNRVALAREKYDNLSQAAQDLVTNYEKLLALETVLEALEQGYEYDVRDVLKCISDVVNTDTVEELLITNQFVDVEWTSSNPDLYYFEDGFAKVSVVNQTHRKQTVEVTAKITRKTGEVVELSKIITVNPVKYEDLPSTPVATYFGVGALSSYKTYSDRYKKENTIFSDKAKETLDIVYYAFANIDDQGNCRLSSETPLAEVMELKKHNVRIIVSVEGVSTASSMAFKTVTADDTLRAKFVDNLMDLVELYKFDGIDIDWESTSGCSVVAVSMNKLMRELRAEMTERQDAGGTPYFLSAAIPGTTWGAANDRFDLKTLNNYVDYINMMSYDLHNTQIATHVSPLYSSKKDNGYGFSCDSGVKLFVSKGLDKEKIIIGSAGYGKAYKLSIKPSVNATLPGLGYNGSVTKISGINSGSFSSGTLYGSAIQELLKSGRFTAYNEYDGDKFVGSCLYDSTNNIFVTYDSAESFEMKYQYASASAGMGIMCWSYTEDTADNYVNAIYNYINK